MPADDAMVLAIDLYRTDDYVRDGRIGLVPLLRTVFEPVFGNLDGARFQLTLHPVSDPAELDGAPSVVNLRRSHGYMQVRIERDGRLLYQHPHTVREIIGRPLQHLLRRRQPEETHWGFGISGPGLELLSLERPAPLAVGGADLHLRGDRPRRFHLEPMPEPDPPPLDVAALGVPGPASAGDAAATVVLGLDVHEELLAGRHFSADIEEGGFLVGHVFDDLARPGRPVVRIVRALPAERTGASLLQFTFTGESFLRINRNVERQPPARGDGWEAPLRLVGWYHTHLFPATDSLGLSTIDVDLHTRTFRRGWQVAALVNIDGDARQLRFYERDGSDMRAVPYLIGPAWNG